MADELRNTDSDRARTGAPDDGGDGPHTVKTHLLHLWQSMHRAPRMSPGDRRRLAAALYID